MKGFISVALILFVTIVSVVAAVDDVDIVQLTESNFESTVHKGNWFVYFSYPIETCQPCAKFQKHIVNLLESQSVKDGVFKIAYVNYGGAQSMKDKYGLTGPPQILLFLEGKEEAINYRGKKWSANHFEGFVLREMYHVVPKPIIEITQETFQETVGKGLWLVEWYTTWCTHCQPLIPIMESIATKAKENQQLPFKVGRIDVEAEGKLADKNSIDSFPVINLFLDGKVIGRYPSEDPRTQDALEAWVSTRFTEYKNELSQKAVKLSTENFETQVMADKSSVWIVKFYAPWCPHCKKLAPIWEEIAVEQSALPEGTPSKFKVGNLDCTTNRDIELKYGGEGYPMVVMFHNGERKEVYRGDRSKASITSWVNEYLATGKTAQEREDAKEELNPGTQVEIVPGEVLTLDQQNFKASIKKGPFFVKFYQTWCGHCKRLAPIWKELAQQADGKYYVAEVNCGENEDLCTKYRATSYPTLIMFYDGKNKKYTTEKGQTRNLETLTAFAHATLGLPVPVATEEAKMEL